MRSTKTILAPDSIPSVAIDFMNNTHHEEVTLVQDIGELVTAYQQSDSHNDEEINKITQSLQNWLSHTQSHFSRENELMQEYGFPAYEIHSNEHVIALERMQTIVSAWESNKDIELLADYIFTLWPAWFNGHVNSMDMITAQFSVANGYKPSS